MQATAPQASHPMRAATSTGPVLRCERAAATAQALAHHVGTSLGAMVYGAGVAMPAAACNPALQPLSPTQPMADLWHAGTALQSGRCGAVHWRSDGHWLWGAVALDEASLGTGHRLARLAQQAYRDVFATLAQSPCRYPLRLWNYLPRINAEQDGMERYRHFNLGRQQAFLQAGHSAFEGAPAACALGPSEGPLIVGFLAGRAPPLPIENPRQTSAYRYPPTYGPRAPTFSRAALADAGGGQLLLFISGTASIVGHQSLHPGDVRAQVRESVHNLRSVIEVANASSSARFALEQMDCVVYVRHAGDLPAIRQELEHALGVDATALANALYVRADICRAELLVEIEAQAFAPGILGPG